MMTITILNGNTRGVRNEICKDWAHHCIMGNRLTTALYVMGLVSYLTRPPFLTISDVRCRKKTYMYK